VTGRLVFDSGHGQTSRYRVFTGPKAYSASYAVITGCSFSWRKAVGA